MTKKKTTTAVARIVERPKTYVAMSVPTDRRMPGAGMTTNPLVAVIACMTDEHVADLGAEIEATETYLNRLKAVHNVVKPKPPEPEPVVAEVVATPEPEPEPEPPPPPPPPPAAPKEPKPRGTPDVPATKAAGTWAGGRPSGSGSPSKIARDMIEADFEVNTNTIISAIRAAKASTASENSLRATISTIRSQIRRAKATNATPAAATSGMKTRPMFPVVVVPPKVETEDEDDDDKEPAEGEDEELDLRKDVAEAVFKKGLMTAGEIVKQCGVPHNRIEAFMKHPWFEYVTRSQQWRLTPQGKQEGVEY